VVQIHSPRPNPSKIYRHSHLKPGSTEGSFLDPTLTPIVKSVGRRHRVLIDLQTDNFDDLLGAYQEVLVIYPDTPSLCDLRGRRDQYAARSSLKAVSAVHRQKSHCHEQGHIHDSDANRAPGFRAVQTYNCQVPPNSPPEKQKQVSRRKKLWRNDVTNNETSDKQTEACRDRVAEY
jgi:hypothetical protein